MHRLTGRALPPWLFSKFYPSIPGRVHIEDQMLASESPAHVRHYLEDGLSAISNIEDSLAMAGATLADVPSLLDYPSGYGRVLRHLVRRVPSERITACDVDRQAVRFCASEFGVTPLVGRVNPEEIRFPHPYQLIFVGSLLTHLPVDACIRFLRVFANLLLPEGQLIFTTQGESCLQHLDWYGERFARAASTYRARLDADGACFQPYSKSSVYGITLHTRDFVERTMHWEFGTTLRLVRFAERGWDRHQDVYSYIRLPQRDELSSAEVQRHSGAGPG